jgi:hypothetical protein
MLIESCGIKQETAAGRRRWFSSHDLELVFWFDLKDDLSGFQLCYYKDGEQRALTWKRPGGFDHSLVDEGDDSHYPETPVLKPDGAVSWDEIAARFQTQAGGLEPTLRQFVRERLTARA